MTLLVIAIIAGLVGLGFASFLTLQVLAEDEGSEEMKRIARAIQQGAAAFLQREYTFLAVFVVVVTAVIAVFVDYDALDKFGSDNGELTDAPRTAIAYVIGAIASAGAGFIGMSIAVRANVRTTAKAREALNPALRVAFSSGAVMGLTATAVSLLCLSILYIIFQDVRPLTGFAFGASSIALFARVGGGIYTKAADVGGDLVGKVEAGIPEDDPRNPATIADAVGDNVGDVAGMGADLFESYTGAIVATMSLAFVAIAGLTTTGDNATFDAVTSAPEQLPPYDSDAFVLPFVIMGIGIFSSILGTFLVRTGEQADIGRLLWALRLGVFGASGLVLLGTAITILAMDLDFKLFFAVMVGLFAGQFIGTATEYFTAYEYRPTKALAAQAETGAATIIIGGLGLGMLSTAIPLLTIVAAIGITYELAGLYGIALAAVGMLSPLGITLATDAYGPVADNAGGIAEQAHLPPEVRERTDALDSLGNTTAATGKGFAIGSAVLTALALMVTYSQIVGIEVFNLLSIEVLVGLLIGALMPFIFGALTMLAVGRAANAMIEEVRRQFREKPGILKGEEDPDYSRTVSISTEGALREMIVPGALAIVVPILVGAAISAEALGGLLIGSIASGSLLALMMANSGGAWDNAKKYIEAGEHGGKGSDAHKAAVVGDTVGDPFKDTSGPAMNILLKLMAIVAVVFGPIFL